MRSKNHIAIKRLATTALAFALLFAIQPFFPRAADMPNIILVVADDISERDLPVYGSNVWSPLAASALSG